MTSPSPPKQADASLVSVIVIFQNEERFLPDAVESVYDQTHHDWELILVDDGSTDASTDYAQTQASARGDRVRYLDHPGHRNLGMSASRNAGIAAAQGRFVAFLDADDLWLPGKLTAQVSAMHSHPEVGFTVSPAQYWHSWTGHPDDLARDHDQQLLLELDLDDDAVVDPPALLLDFLRDEWRSLCDVLVRREVIEEVGGYDPRFRGMYEDQVFHAKLCLRYPAHVGARTWYRYRQHPSACTAKAHAAGDWVRARRRFLRWLDSHVSASGDSDVRTLVTTQRRALQPSRRLVRRLAARLDRIEVRR